MSKGPGRVQRALVAAFEQEPRRKFTVEELAEIVYPECAVSEVQRDTVRRALAKLEQSLQLHRCRIGEFKKRGWHYVIGLSG